MVLKNRSFVLLLAGMLMLCRHAEGQDNGVSEIPSHASVSALIVNMTSGDHVFEISPARTLTSASLMKLVTTATALERLEPDHTFSTRFWATGPVENRILKGDLILEGGGDPTLGSRYFDENGPGKVLSQIETFLEKEGIEYIDGAILVDEHYLRGSRYPSRRLWEDMGNYYGAPPAALSWKDNTFKLELTSPSTPGEICHVASTEPHIPGVSFDCRVRAATHKKDSAYIYGVPGMPSYEVRGSIPAGRSSFIIKGAIPEPGLMLAGEVSDLFPEMEGVTVSKTDHQSWKKNARLLGEIVSPPLEKIIREINRHSINLAADHILVALGRAGSDTLSTDWDKGLRSIRDHWEKQIGDHYINIRDGSGLAPMNTLSAGFLVDMLHYMYQESPHFGAFKRSLAQSGGSGTLKNMWKEKGLKGRVFGKSGYMGDVAGYAGYVLRPGEAPLAFAFLVNHHGMEGAEMREIVENLGYEAFGESKKD
ncbi:MAG: D-alanyl-D-alanine carboxypeptidase/D-alanyl-D-alanine-endopeptidase [Marinilabilia sp.]